MDLRDEVKAWHEAADRTNDSHDHDELHAAAQVLGSDPIWAESDRYVSRWLQGLRELHHLPSSPE